MLAVLAVVLAGKGFAAAEEAGLLDLHPLKLPRVEQLGFFPTIEGVAAAAVTLAILVIGFCGRAAGAGPRRLVTWRDLVTHSRIDRPRL